MASPSSLHKAAERNHSLGIEGAPGHGLQVFGQRRGEPAQCQHDHSDQPLAEPTLPRPGHLPRSRLHFSLRCAQSASGPKALLAFGCCAVLQAAQAPILSRRRTRSAPLPSTWRPLFSGGLAGKTRWTAAPTAGPGCSLPGLAPVTSARKARGLPPASAQQRHCGGCVPSPRRGLFADDSLAAPRPRPRPTISASGNNGSLTSTQIHSSGFPRGRLDMSSFFLAATLGLRAPPTATVLARGTQKSRELALDERVPSV